MRISIKSLGPINNGDIEIESPLIVLTGPNNTGKSYLTYLIHGLSQYEDLVDSAELRERVSSVFREEQIIRDISESKGDILANELIKEKLPQLINLLIPLIQENSYKIFSSKSIKSDFRLESFSSIITEDNSSIHKVRVLDDKISFVSINGAVSTSAVTNKHLISYGHHQSVVDVFYVLALLSFDIVFRKRTYFFPAERTAINLFAKHITATKAEIKDELDSDVIAGMSNEELGQRLRKQVKAAPKYPYAIKDYINFVNNFTRTEEGAFAPIAAQIEAILVGGKLQVDEFEQLVFIPNTSAVSLELHLSSSLVKSLSYLILYLRYTAREDDQVIIDEPELNLHPDLQIAIARIIARMVNAGLKVIISTHSDYLLKELNNLILLGELNKNERHKHFVIEKGLTENELLTKAQVRAYFLHNKIESGISVEPINLVEDGLVVPTINDAIRRVDGLAEEVYMEMES